MFYVGNTFDEKANKGYKTIQNAKKAAEKDGLSVWDEEGVKLYPLKVEVTDDVPDDAALEEKPDGSVNAYDETGEKVGEVSAEEVKEIMDEITAEDVEAAAAAARSEEEVHGTIRGKYELQTTNGMQRFQVRNARVSLDGKVLPVIAYKAEIDLSDEGSIKMLDAYARFVPNDTWNVTLGQMRVPFTIDAHRSPHQQYFANRSFIAKQVGNVRDVGATGAFSLKEGLPLKLEGGLFNGSGLTNQKEWHNTLNYSVKLQLMPWKNYNLTLSTQKIHPDKISIYMYDIGTYYEFDNWHIEAEYLYKTYAKNSFDDVHAFNAFVNYDLFIKKGLFQKISFLGRYDSMGDHSNGNADEDGKLYITDYSRQRVTGGVTLSFGKAFQADLRLNYEKYFYDKLSLAKESEQDKFVMELMVRF